VLLAQDARGKRLGGVVVADRNRGLDDDGSVVEKLVDEVDRASAHLHAVLQSLVLGVETGEGRQQRRMDIQDALGKLAHEVSRQQAHEARQADQVHLPPAQFGHHHAVVHFAVQPFRGDAHGRDAAPPRDLEPRGLGAIGDHHRDGGADTAGGGAVGDGLEVRPASGAQNAQVLLW
jgi:hypothetical protein